MLLSRRNIWSPGLLPPSTPLAGNGVDLWPLGKVVHSNHNVLLSWVTLREGTCYIDGYPLEWGPDVLMRKAQNPGLRATTGCAGVTVPALLINTLSCLDPVMSSSHLAQGLVETQVSS
jgi:hypothetical protein